MIGNQSGTDSETVLKNGVVAEHVCKKQRPSKKCDLELQLLAGKDKTRHSDIGPSAYFAKLDKKKVNEEKEIEKHRK